MGNDGRVVLEGGGQLLTLGNETVPVPHKEGDLVLPCCQIYPKHLFAKITSPALSGWSLFAGN